MAYNWKAFAHLYNLPDKTISNFVTYAHMISDWNKKFNLTTITKEEEIAQLHFADSLTLNQLIDLRQINYIADIGTGAGIPGVPLKICYPHLSLILIEVNSKKRLFLQEVITVLGLTQVEIVDNDWRTFLRKTNYQIDLFCARASLPPEELVRVFKDASPYKNSALIYWASKHWEPSVEISSYINDRYMYTIANRSYTLIKMTKTRTQ
ncbi:MAG TPA: 16S rRNA (guanine(527)-N(7))-methyltransferase RsmG [Patescibacteria group bacterium]|jgi:16S rRNA (guanine527-N7)-methyltransferase|nr:16S rRNA (guanine(527)-N(7))-methyltransferase RsmG [Patescibacteria group bacterium]